MGVDRAKIDVLGGTLAENPGQMSPCSLEIDYISSNIAHRPRTATQYVPPTLVFRKLS